VDYSTAMKQLLNLNRIAKDSGCMELPNSNRTTQEKLSCDIVHNNLTPSYYSLCVEEAFKLTCTSHFKGWFPNQSYFRATQLLCKQSYYDNNLLIPYAIKRTLYEWKEIDQIMLFSKSPPSLADRFVSTMFTYSVCPGFHGYNF
jgi:hypothetical protein